MNTTTTNGRLYVNLCAKVGHKRYQNIFEDYEAGTAHCYESDDPAIKDALNDMENGAPSNSYLSEEVEYKGDDDLYAAEINKMHLQAEAAIIWHIVEYGYEIEQ